MYVVDGDPTSKQTPPIVYLQIDYHVTSTNIPLTFQTFCVINLNQLNKTRVCIAISGSIFLLAADWIPHAAGSGVLGRTKHRGK